MKKNIFILFIISLFIVGCDSYEEEYNQVRDENTQLDNRVDSLQNEINDIKDSPAYLIGQAHNEFSQGNYNEVEKILFRIQEEYPEWNKRLILQYLDEVRALIDKASRQPR